MIDKHIAWLWSVSREGQQRYEESEHSPVGADEGMGWVSLEKRSSGKSSWVCNPRQEVVVRGGQILLSGNSDGMRSDGLKFFQERVRLGIGNNLFSQRAVRQWHSCPGRGGGGAPIPGGVPELWGGGGGRGGGGGGGGSPHPWRCPRAVGMWH